MVPAPALAHELCHLSLLLGPLFHSEPLAYLQLPELRFQGHNGLLCPHVLNPHPRPNPRCIHGVLLLWWEQPGGGAGGGGLLAQGLVQTGRGQRSACKSHPQALPPGLPGLAQNGDAPESLGPFIESPLACPRFASSPPSPLTAFRWGVFFHAFPASCCFGAILGHWLSPGRRKAQQHSWGSKRV